MDDRTIITFPFDEVQGMDTPLSAADVREMNTQLFGNKIVSRFIFERISPSEFEVSGIALLGAYCRMKDEQLDLSSAPVTATFLCLRPIVMSMTCGFVATESPEEGDLIIADISYAMGGGWTIVPRRVKVECPFPVGAVYTSTSSENPSLMWEGTTWESFASGRVVVGQGGSYTNGATGGAETHTLTAAQMPSHTHTVGSHTHQMTDTSTTSMLAMNNTIAMGGRSAWTSGTGTQYNSLARTNNTLNADFGVRRPVNTQAAGGGTTGAAGSGTSHNNMQPYIVAHMWKRTS
ncbi:MAG: hypothetical protein FWE46_04290 [Coriobacteriia bacterium]|nr:hypothetical protein [Coriobacteriia bacterium]MCL2537175.1 hypothetical protein [Coriobacteriia bacterium]